MRIRISMLLIICIMFFASCGYSEPVLPSNVEEDALMQSSPGSSELETYCETFSDFDEVNEFDETTSDNIIGNIIGDSESGDGMQYDQMSDNSWRNNVLSKSGLDAFKIDREDIYAVTFLDTIFDAPDKTWHLGTGSSKSVQGWLEYDNARTHVYIAAEGGINAKLCAEGFFEGCTNLREIHFNGAFHTEEAEYMNNMFYGCERLVTIDLKAFDTSNVVTMYQMFRDCRSLKSLDVSSFDTSKVKNMSCMFSTCVDLTSLDLSNFDTSNVTNMCYMFSACRNLEAVDTSSFDTSRVVDMSGMFRWCDMLKSLNLDEWSFESLELYEGFMNEGITIDGQPWEDLFK